MSIAYLGLGSNIQPEMNIASAMQALRSDFKHARFSPLYRSPAVGLEGDDFINLAAGVDTTLHPLELKLYLHELEDRQNRDRSVPKWSSRTLDIDILLYDDLYLVSPELEIPRKEILDMAHVLKPLADIAPDRVHPIEGVSMDELWRGLEAKTQNHGLVEM